MNKALLPDSYLFNDSYKIVRKLGQGGFSITYLATNQLGKKLTIKELFVYGKSKRGEQGEVVFEGFADVELEKIRQQFKAEGELLLKMEPAKNEHIVKVLDLFSENNTLYLVLDYVEGQTLTTLIKEEGPLFFSRLENYVYQIGGALSALHRNGLYHLDVKPDNIIITPQDTAVLIDFGLCRGIATSEETTLPYSRRFAAPEQVKGLAKPNARLDIYALAATIFYALTAEAPPPVSAPDFLQKLEGQANTLKQGLAKAMSENPRQRYPDIYQFLAALNIGEALDITVLPETRSEKPPPVKKRKRSFAPLRWAAAILFLAVIAYVAYTNLPEIPSSSTEKVQLGAFVFEPEPKQEEDPVIPEPKKPEVDSSKVKVVKDRPTFNWAGSISRAGKPTIHRVEMNIIIDTQKDENDLRRVSGNCKVSDTASPARFAKFRITGHYDEELSNLHIETGESQGQNNFNYCPFQSDFSYEEGDTRIKANFQPRVGSGIRDTECKVFRMSSEIRLNRL